MTNLAADQSPHQRQLLDRASRPDCAAGSITPPRRAVVSALSGSPATCIPVEQATGSHRPEQAHQRASGRCAVRAVRRSTRQRVPAVCRDLPADTYQLIKAGLVGGKGVPTTVAGHPAVFATLTAPSFGRSTRVW
jgi:hypothetical protein